MYYYSQNLTPHQVVFFPLLLAVAANGEPRRDSPSNVDFSGGDGDAAAVLRCEAMGDFV